MPSHFKVGTTGIEVAPVQCLLNLFCSWVLFNRLLIKIERRTREFSRGRRDEPFKEKFSVGAGSRVAERCWPDVQEVDSINFPRKLRLFLPCPERRQCPHLMDGVEIFFALRLAQVNLEVPVFQKKPVWSRQGLSLSHSCADQGTFGLV